MDECRNCEFVAIYDKLLSTDAWMRPYVGQGL